MSATNFDPSKLEAVALAIGEVAEAAADMKDAIGMLMILASSIEILMIVRAALLDGHSQQEALEIAASRGHAFAS